MGDKIVRERRGETRGKHVLQVCGVRWEVVRRLFPLMRASGGQTIRCGESRKKEAEVEGRSVDADSGVPGLSTPNYGRVRPAIWAGCDGR